MKSLIIPSVAVIATMLALSAPANATNINHLVSASTLTQYCAGKSSGREYHVELKQADGSTLRGEVECGEDHDGRGDNERDGDDNDRDGNDHDRDDDRDRDRNDRDHNDRDDNDDRDGDDD